MIARNNITRLFVAFIAATLLIPTPPAHSQDPKPAEQRVQIEGKVVDENDVPVAGVTVHVYLRDSEVGTASTDAKGNYALSIPLKREIVTIVADDQSGDRQGFLFPGLLTENTQLVPINLRPTRHTLIKVVDAAGNPVAGATVAAPAVPVETPLEQNMFFQGDTFFRRTSDQNGIVRLHYTDDNRIYQIVAFKSGVGFDYYVEPGPAPQAAGRTVPLPATRLPDAIILKLTGARMLKVKATDPAGHAVPGIEFYPTEIKLDGKSTSFTTIGGSLVMGGTTDASGTILLDWLPKDFVGITFRTHHESGYETQIDGNTTDILRISGSKPRDEVAFAVVPLMKISGHIFGPDGKPIGGVRIQIQSQGRPLPVRPSAGSAASKPDGSYSVLVSRKPSYTLRITDSRWVAQDQEIPTTASDSIDNVDFKLSEGTIIHGTLTEAPDHNPLPREIVQIVSIDGATSKIRRGAPSGPDGHFEFRVPPGRYTITSASRQLEIEVNGEREIVKDIELPAVEKVPLTGKAVDADGRPLAGLTVEGICTDPVDHGSTFSAVTAADGTFRLTRPKAHCMLFILSPLGTSIVNASAAAVAEIGPDQKEVTLQPHACVEARGRLVNDSGEPVKDGAIEYALEVSTELGRYLVSRLAPASDGSYTLPHVIPGAPMAIYYLKTNSSPSIPIKSFTAEPGQNLDLGDTSIPKDKPSQTTAQ
jgi:hypothetical protein